MCEPGSPENHRPHETDLRESRECRAVLLSAKAASTSLLWNLSVSNSPVVVEDGMSERNGQRKPGTARGPPRRSRTAKALRISRWAVKSRCACEWGGWGRLSDDGPGQHNPDRSEGPWSRAMFARMAVFPPSRWSPTQCGRLTLPRREHEGWRQT